MKNKEKWLRYARFIVAGVGLGIVYNILIGCSGACLMGGSPMSVMMQLGFFGWIIAKLTEKE